MGSSSLQEAPQQLQSGRAHPGEFSTESYEQAGDGLFRPLGSVSPSIAVLRLRCWSSPKKKQFQESLCSFNHCALCEL